MTDAQEQAVRLDIWLWRARFFRTRTLATDFVSRKGVRLSRSGQTWRSDKPGLRIQPGDLLTFYQNRTIRQIEICQLGIRRGPAAEAQTLYIDHPPET